MPIIIPISSIDDTGIQSFRISKHKHELHQSGLFVAEGEKVVSRLFNSKIAVRSLLLSQRAYTRFQSILESERFSDLEIFLADDSLLATIVGYEIHQGIMALGEVPADLSPEECIETTPSPRLFIALERVTNTDNVGGIVRNATAFDADLLIAGKSSASPYCRRAVRNSMGTIFKLPVYHTKELYSVLSDIKSRHNFKIVAAHPDGTTQLHEANFLHDTCLLFGNEDIGIDPALFDLCDELVTIPMKNETDSLNVANASAVFLYEVMRQRK